MRSTCILLILFVPSVLFAQDDFPKSFELVIRNPIDAKRESVYVEVFREDVMAKIPDFSPDGFAVFDGPTEIPSQFNRGLFPGISFVISSLNALETRTLSVKYNPSKRISHNYPRQTQAELSHKTAGAWNGAEYVGGKFINVDFLRVPEKHKSHSWYIRYEGPGWESDKVAYRLYLDERNAVDVFGKTVHELVLQTVGLNNFESYHELQPWGMDIMKVGNSLGVGSVGYRVNNKTSRVEHTDSVSCRILDNGPVYSEFLTTYSGWNNGNEKGILRVNTSIHAGTRLTAQALNFSGLQGGFCTGIIKDKKADMFSDFGRESSFGYLCTYGRQSLNNDDLGLVVFFDPLDVQEISSDEENYLVVFKNQERSLRYFFAAAWSKEKNGITSRDEFMTFVKTTARELANPVVVNIK